MKTFTLLSSFLVLLMSTAAWAGPVNPLNCFCAFEGVLPDGLGHVDGTDCQITEGTSYARERGQKGAYTETLTFVGGAGQACATLQVAKSKVGNNTTFECVIHLRESTSSDATNCQVIIPGDRPVNDMGISHRNMRACERLLDDVADQVFALPDCRAP